MKLRDALQRVALLADSALQSQRDMSVADEDALDRFDAIIAALEKHAADRLDDLAISANKLDPSKARRPIIIDPEITADAVELIAADNRRGREPTRTLFDCAICDDTGITRHLNRRGYRVSTGRPCPHCGDAPADVVSVRLNSTGRVVVPHQQDLRSVEIAELTNLSSDAPDSGVRARARAVLNSVASRPSGTPIVNRPSTRRIPESLDREGPNQMRVPTGRFMDGGAPMYRTVTVGERLTDYERSTLHEWRSDGHSCSDIITAILMAEPGRTGTPSLAEALDEAGVVEAVAEPERPPQGAPKQPWERRDIHYVKIGTSSDEHGVEIIRPGDYLNERVQATLRRSLALIARNSGTRRARGEHAHRAAMIQRILEEHVPF